MATAGTIWVDGRMRRPVRLHRRLGVQEQATSCKNDVYLLPKEFVGQVVTRQLPAVGAVLTVFAHVPSRNGFCRSWVH